VLGAGEIGIKTRGETKSRHASGTEKKQEGAHRNGFQ